MPSNVNDLTQHAPRSARVRLGGFVHLPRLLDKCRASLAGTNGEYSYNCPLDQHFFQFTGIDAEALKKEVASGKGDGDILEWVKANAKPNRHDFEIAAWSAWMEARVPDNVEGREFFHGAHGAAAPKREDIGSWFDLLDLDDYASYGGKP
jgi:hypothetical protein